MSRGLYQVVSQWGGGGVLTRQGWLYRPPPVQVWELAAASLHVARCLRSELSVVCIFCMWSSQLRCRQSHFALGPLFWDIRCKVSAVVPWASETRQRTKEKEVRLFIQILFFFFWRVLVCTWALCSPAAAAKSLPWCPTLCDPTDGSPPGSPVPGILQARALEWVPLPSPTRY